MELSFLRRACARSAVTSVVRVQSSALPGTRLLHQSKSLAATPVNHPNIPGPPPGPPQASAEQPEEILARKRKQAELLNRAQALSKAPSKPASPLQRRFWKQVHVKEEQDGLRVLLDTRPVRMASKQILTLPPSKRALATAIAMEWDLLVSAQQALKQHYIPLTSLTARALDIEIADKQGKTKIREDAIKMMMRHLRTDTLLCWAPENDANDPTGMNAGDPKAGKQTLRQKQQAAAEPVIAYLKTHIFPGVEIEPILDVDSILPRTQPEATQQIVQGWLHGLPAFELAALERGVLATKSLLIAMRLLVDWSREFRDLQVTSGLPKFTVSDAALASRIEVTWQTDMWGEVEDTHDVEKEDLARQLGSVVLLVS